MANYKFFDPAIDDIDTIRAIRKKCFDLIAEGKTLIEYSAEGSSGKKAVLVPIEDLLYETRMVLRDMTGNYPVDAVRVFFA